VAKRLEMPGFIKPQLATLKSKAPKGEQWIHEIKYDGYRVQLHVDSGKKKVFTRNGLDWTKRFSTIAGAFDVPGQAIIDGEVVVIHEGRTNFSELQADLAAGGQDRLVFYAFDLLWRDGDVRKLPQLERKQMLRDLIGENDIDLPVLYSEHLTGDGQEVFEHAAKLNWEGIISKRVDAPYRADGGLAENQNRDEGEIPGHRVYQGSHRRRRALPRQAGGERAGLHGQGRDRVESHYVQPNPQGSRHRRESKEQAE
jgi:bifunctional non-homologous end joining protein LigD